MSIERIRNKSVKFRDKSILKSQEPRINLHSAVNYRNSYLISNNAEAFRYYITNWRLVFLSLIYSNQWSYEIVQNVKFNHLCNNTNGQINYVVMN